MAVTWVDPPTEVTVGAAAAFTDVDVSGTIPSGSTGVILHIVNTDTSNALAVGYRKNGSTDNRIDDITRDSHMWVAIGVDSSRIFEAYSENTTSIDVYLVGAFDDKTTFQTNADDVSTTLSGWKDIDVSAETGGDTATGVIIEVVLATNDEWGIRKNGSTDSRREKSDRHSWGMIGVDGSEIFEGNIDSNSADFFMVGYTTAEAVFNTNANDVSLGSTGTWIDLTALAADATGGIYEIFTGGGSSYGFRKDGTSENIVIPSRRHKWSLVEAASQVVEGQISGTAMDFFEIGYFEPAAATGRIMSSLAGSGGLAGPGGIAGPGGGLAGA